MNAELGWTKGPWRASETWRPPIGNFPIRDDVNANGDIFWGYAIHGRDERGVEVLPTLAAVHNFPKNVHANARLIAAAPELYEALAELVQTGIQGAADDGEDDLIEATPHLDKARAALAKARGETTP